MADDALQRPLVTGPRSLSAAATKRTRPRTVEPVSAEQHNRVLAAALDRVDRLEPRLARILEPILVRQGKLAAERFRHRATNHLAAAAANLGGGNSTMICVRPRPDEAAAIADPNGDAPESLHVTLVSVGQYDGLLRDLADAVKPVAASLAPLEGTVGGYGVFDPPGVGILLPDVRGLVELRVAVCEALLGAGIGYARQHGFEAHITVHADPTPAEQEAALERAVGEELHFDAIVVVRGNREEVVLPLVGIPALTAAGPPAWTAPFPDELINVDALVAEILGQTEPVRQAMIEQTMTPALKQAGLSWDVTNPLAAQALASSASQVRSIAETTQLNVMRVIRSAYQNGLSIPQTSNLIQEGMTAASKTRATMIARTELGRAANAGSLAATQLVAGATKTTYSKTWKTAPGARYPRHEDYDGLDGQNVPLDGTFQVGVDQLQYPGDPAGDPGETINCVPGETLIQTPSLRATMRRWYEGDLVRIRLASGDELAATPNHPVLRSDGAWVPIGSVEEGDHLVSATFVGRDVGAPDPERPPAAISEVYRLTEMARDPERVRVTPPDFHGDGGDGEVDVVPVDGSLLVDCEAASDEQVTKFGLALAYGARAGASGGEMLTLGDLMGRGLAATFASAGIVRGLREGATLVFAQTSHPQRVRSGTGAGDEAELLEAVPDHCSADPESFADGKHAVSVVVTVAEVIEIEVEPFHGYVYNLDTGLGWYTAGSLVCGNCRCTMVYETPEGEQEADAEDPPELDSGDSAGGGGGGGALTLPGGALSAPLGPLEGKDAAGLASSMASRAAVIEPALTDAMQKSADAVGAKLVGLDFRLKSEESAARKIASDALERTQTVRETAYGVSDMVRYTAELPTDQYVEGTRSMLTDLQDRGFRIARFRNTWTPDAPYAGVNVQMAARNGYRFELQFHTPESWALKTDVNHPLYEEWRLLPPKSPRAIELTNEMVANTAKVPVPPSVRDFQFGQPTASTEIGVTPFRAGEDPIGFYDSAKYQQFTDQVNTTANDYGVTVDGLEHMTGVWQGETEPSVAIRAHDGELGLRAFASSLGQSYNQDGVLLFGSEGSDVIATFPVSTQEAAFAAMRDAGLDAGRLTSDGRLQVIGPEGPEFRAQLAKVEGSLGQPGYERGSFGLLERDSGDYQRAVDAFQSDGQLALRSPTSAVENTTSSLDPTGKQIDETLSTVGEYLSFPGQTGGEPAVDARIVGDPKISGIPVEGVFDPSDMTIKVRRLTTDPRATFTHELGHALDHLSARGAETYATDSIADSGLSDWYDAVQASPTYQKLDQALADKEAAARAAGVELDPGKSIGIGGGYYYVAGIRYALNPVELWARSFVQWFSRRDPVLGEHVATMLGRKEQQPGFWYWSDSEFAPIDAAMTEWFRSRGLLVGG